MDGSQLQPNVFSHLSYMQKVSVTFRLERVGCPVITSIPRMCLGPPAGEEPAIFPTAGIFSGPCVGSTDNWQEMQMRCQFKTV